MKDHNNLKNIISLKDLDFPQTVSIKTGENDFLNDSSWKEDFISGRIELCEYNQNDK